MRLRRHWMTVPLAAVALCLLATAPASADDGLDGVPLSVEEPGVFRVVDSAQQEVDSDPDRRLVERESGERVDAVVISLWTIAAAMTVLLGLFLWHTSPRRRLRLAEAHAAEVSGEAAGGAEPSGGESGEDEPFDGKSGRDSAYGVAAARVREALGWLRSKVVPVPREESVPVGDDAREESDGESVDESAVWEFGSRQGAQDGGERSV